MCWRLGGRSAGFSRLSIVDVLLAGEWPGVKVFWDCIGRIVVTMPSLDADLVTTGGGRLMVSMMRRIERNESKSRWTSKMSVSLTSCCRKMEHGGGWCGLGFFEQLRLKSTEGCWCEHADGDTRLFNERTSRLDDQLPTCDPTLEEEARCKSHENFARSGKSSRKSQATSAKQSHFKKVLRMKKVLRVNRCSRC